MKLKDKLGYFTCIPLTVLAIYVLEDKYGIENLPKIFIFIIGVLIIFVYMYVCMRLYTL
ncbi:hypothetical protein N3C_2835 [Clostridium sp. N3C]|uniref:hypothetical protein n=1 Tax=Clostridium sp. N3C TaxID=1776758 RepID=UPI00092DF043|nr:hypothetical protein [Clostridium sp. N3C]SCN26448.1 hypothetical protein N3C_2835 [Clostridium sp. N3C]